MVAAPFESVTTHIGNVRFELLLDPGHTRNLGALADAGNEVKEWIADRIEDLSASGLGYPYDGFTVVEVPTVLRGFKGGWRLDTALAPPTMALIRESGFPTALYLLASSQNANDSRNDQPSQSPDLLSLVHPLLRTLR